MNLKLLLSLILNPLAIKYLSNKADVFPVSTLVNIASYYKIKKITIKKCLKINIENPYNFLPPSFFCDNTFDGVRDVIEST